MTRGSGILFYRKNGHATEVLLGRRRFAPDKDTWSIPAGRMEACDEGDFCLCALRETCEEFFRNQPDELAWLRSVVDKQLYVNFHIPLMYHFRIYIIRVEQIPEVFHNHEFHETRWVPVDDLPSKTQGGVLYALKKMKKRGLV